jgi:hypothetical protein
LDEKLNRLIISVASLTNSPFLEPIIATLESQRKIEILKAHAKQIKQLDWRKGLERVVENVEKVNKARNIASHSALRFDEGNPVLINIAAAKLLKNLHSNKTPISDLISAIEIAENTFSEIDNAIVNFDRVHAARVARGS